MKKLFVIFSVLILVLAAVGTANSDDRKDRHLQNKTPPSFSRPHETPRSTAAPSETRTPRSPGLFNNTPHNNGMIAPNLPRSHDMSGSKTPFKTRTPRLYNDAPRDFGSVATPRSSIPSNPTIRQYRRPKNDSSDPNTKGSLRDGLLPPSVRKSNRPTTESSGRLDRQNNTVPDLSRRTRTDQRNSILYPNLPKNTDKSRLPTGERRNHGTSDLNTRTPRTLDRPTMRTKSSAEIRHDVNGWNHTNTNNFHGAKIPERAEKFNRSGSLRERYNHVVSAIGSVPHNRFYFTPRSSRYRHHASIFDCYYPYYIVIRPSDGCFFSVFFNWGWCPTWVESTRVVILEDTIYYPTDPYQRLDVIGANQAIHDLRDAWLESDISLIDKHLSSEKVSIYFDGKYSYSVESNDYYAMLSDQFTMIETSSLTFNPVVWMSPQEIYISGSQVYKDPDDNEATLYVSFRLGKIGGIWNIVSFGSSKDPIGNPYTDFRE